VLKTEASGWGIAIIHRNGVFNLQKLCVDGLGEGIPSLILADHPWSVPRAVFDSTVLWNRRLQSRCRDTLTQSSEDFYIGSI